MSVRRFPTKRKLTGICVRFPKDTIAEFKRAQVKLKITTLNKLLNRLAMQGLQLTSRKSLDLSIPPSLEELRHNPHAMESFARILTMGSRSLPNTKTYTKWVSITPGLESMLAAIAHNLLWSEGQVIQQAILASLQLICNQTRPLSPLLRLSWGNRAIVRRYR